MVVRFVLLVGNSELGKASICAGRQTHEEGQAGKREGREEKEHGDRSIRPCSVFKFLA